MTLPALAAERSAGVCGQQGAQQQTSRTQLLMSIAETEDSLG